VSNKKKQLSNPVSTGGGGGHFEAHIQASFVALMLTGGHAPCLPCWPIVEINLQGKIDGFETDDVIVFVENSISGERRKLLGQVKRSISITQGSTVLSEVIQAAWNDFNNSHVFTKDKDIIALITRPLNKTDFDNVQWLLSQSRHTKDADEFYRHVGQTNFSPSKSLEKLNVIQYHLKIANNNLDVSRDEVYCFLKHFHLLGYDLGEEVGVVLSLLHSHISQFHQQHPKWVWYQIVDIVQTWNQNAGTITLENLPEDLREIFRQPVLSRIPIELTKPPDETVVQTNWIQDLYAADLALINTIGAWHENNEADLAIISKITNQSYSVWIQKVREILNFPDSPFILKNGLWIIRERTEFWDLLSLHLFDTNLDTFKKCAVEVLTERDPSFELPLEERYLAIIHGKKLLHSVDLRKGIASGLAMLGSRNHKLIHCSQGKAESTVILAIREIFTDADWMLWSSLNNLLPMLAEAAPNEFLNAVEHALSQSPCPFNELFPQKGNDYMSTNYLIGLLWSLEKLAWDQEYLVRVCIILGELSYSDSDNQWQNQPANSLLKILLPWYPQTTAPIEKCQVAVKTLCEERPENAWKLLLNLLPSQHQMTSGTSKPIWRNPIAEDWKRDITSQEYWDQVSCYAELAISMAGSDCVKLGELIDCFDQLPDPYFDRLREVLQSDNILNLSEPERLYLYDRLREFTSKHRKFKDAKWALKDELLSPLEQVTLQLSPSNPFYLYQYLFSNRSFDPYEEIDNHQEQQKKLDEHYQQAISEVFQQGGVESVIKFAEAVEYPDRVGYALGSIADREIDRVLLPAYLGTENRKLSTFVSGYIWRCRYINGWLWADELDKSGWHSKQVVQLLCSLPFTQETWNRASEWLGDRQGEYWLKTNVDIHQADGDLGLVLDRLIEYKRPRAAIDCLSAVLGKEKSLDIPRCVKALLAAVSSPEPLSSMDWYHTTKMIKALQDNPEVNPDDLFNIEWAYLPLLDRDRGSAPKLLESRLASDPELFCEVIQLIYRSKKADVNTSKVSEQSKDIATNAWRLLEEWHIIPGVQADGSFDEVHFSNWLQKVKEICTESGHLDVALIQVGQVLIHCPPDSDLLWIDRAVAKALNAKDAEVMRSGFSTGLFNSRGIYHVDPSGQAERKLAAVYRQKAEDVENAGYQRLAVTLRGISKSYDRDAEDPRHFE
jgi:hypothetical protein